MQAYNCRPRPDSESSPSEVIVVASGAKAAFASPCATETLQNCESSAKSIMMIVRAQLTLVDKGPPGRRGPAAIDPPLYYSIAAYGENAEIQDLGVWLIVWTV